MARLSTEQLLAVRIRPEATRHDQIQHVRAVKIREAAHPVSPAQRRRDTAILAAVAAIVGLVVAGSMWLDTATRLQPPMPSPIVHEDEPGWRCWQHGNLICGRPGGHLPGTAPLSR